MHRAWGSWGSVALLITQQVRLWAAMNKEINKARESHFLQWQMFVEWISPGWLKHDRWVIKGPWRPSHLVFLNLGRGPEICFFYQKRIKLIQHTQVLLRMRKLSSWKMKKWAQVLLSLLAPMFFLPRPWPANTQLPFKTSFTSASLVKPSWCSLVELVAPSSGLLCGFHFHNS